MCVGGKEGDPNYPNSPVNTGDILELTIHGYVFIACYGVTVTRDTVSKYPHLFRPMPWWEGRQPEDMPEYVRIKNKVLRVVKYNLTFGEFLPEKSKYMKRLEYTQPATEQEYLDYIKQKEVTNVN